MSNPSALLSPGLVSISFRSWTPAEVVLQARKARLQAIEWGGDVHVPHGDTKRAADVGALTREEGLEVAAYGSYYRVGGGVGPEWEPVLDSACALGARVVRVWAGGLGSDSPAADAAHWERVATDAARIARSAEAAGVRVAFEYHGGVLTDGLAQTLRLLSAANHENLCLYWQPQHHQVTATGLEELAAFAPRLAHVHVFSWIGRWEDKRHLSTYEDRWRLYLAAARRAPELKTPGGACIPRRAMLEFIPDESAEGLQRDAATLRAWLE